MCPYYRLYREIFISKKSQVITKKIKAFLACGVPVFSMALAVQEVYTSSTQSEIFAGINYYAQHHDGDANWKAKAGVATRAGSVISSACMKAALIGSGAGPVGTILTVGAVAL